MPPAAFIRLPVAGQSIRVVHPTNRSVWAHTTAKQVDLATGVVEVSAAVKADLESRAHGAPSAGMSSMSPTDTDPICPDDYELEPEIQDA